MEKLDLILEKRMILPRTSNTNLSRFIERLNKNRILMFFYEFDEKGLSSTIVHASG